MAHLHWRIGLFICFVVLLYTARPNLLTAQEQNQELLQIDISDSTYNNLVGDIAWNPEGERLAISLVDRILIWNASTLESEAELTDPDGGIGFLYVTWSRDGSLLAATRDGWSVIHIWNMTLEQPEFRETREISLCGINSISWHPDDLTLAITDRCGDLYIWDVSSEQNAPQLIETSEPELVVQWSPLGNQVALLLQEQEFIQVRDTETFSITSELTIQNNSRIEPTAIIIDWIDEGVVLGGIGPSDDNPSQGLFQFIPYIWNPSTNEVSSDFEPNTVERIDALGWDVRGDFLAVGGFSNQTVVIWDIESSRIVSTIDFGAEIWAIDWHPFESKLAIARRDGKIAIWEVAD